MRTTVCSGEITDKIVAMVDCTLTIRSSDEIEFCFTGPNGESVRSEWPYVVKDGWLITTKIQGSLGNGMAGVGHVSLAMRIADDGSLVVRKRERAVGVWVVIPLGTQNDIWFRLQRVPNQAPEPTAPSVTPRAAARVAPAGAVAHL